MCTTKRQEILNFRGLAESSEIYNFCGTNVHGLDIDSHTMCM